MASMENMPVNVNSNKMKMKRKRTAIKIAYPFTYHEEVTMTIQDVNNLGVGVGRVDISDKIRPGGAENSSSRSSSSSSRIASGVDDDDDAFEGMTTTSSEWVVLVPKVLPGEQVIVKVYRNYKNYSEAELVSVVQPSAERVRPKCKYFETCGGCQYQMAPIALQREWKQKQVATALSRIGKIHVDVNACIGTDDHYAYRTKLTPHFNAPWTLADLKIGFQKKGTHIIMDIDECIIASDAINAKYAQVRAMIHTEIEAKGVPKRGATLLFREGNNGFIETVPTNNITQTVSGLVFKYRAGEFFQNNAFALPLLIDHVGDLLKGHGCEYLIDAYCGSGLFSLSAHKQFKMIYGVEISALSVEAAVANARSNKITNVQFITGSSEKIFDGQSVLSASAEDDGGPQPTLSGVDPNKTAVLIDPPRRGCDASFLHQLITFSPKKIVYVSCDPATQARDGKYLVENGYTVTSVTPVDLFPQTRHIENVMCFVRLVDSVTGPASAGEI